MAIKELMGYRVTFMLSYKNNFFIKIQDPPTFKVINLSRELMYTKDKEKED
jgi:hypothetical protein